MFVFFRQTLVMQTETTSSEPQNYKHTSALHYTHNDTFPYIPQYVKTLFPETSSLPKLQISPEIDGVESKIATKLTEAKIRMGESLTMAKIHAMKHAQSVILLCSILILPMKKWFAVEYLTVRQWWTSDEFICTDKIDECICAAQWSDRKTAQSLGYLCDVGCIG